MSKIKANFRLFLLRAVLLYRLRFVSFMPPYLGYLELLSNHLNRWLCWKTMVIDKRLNNIANRLIIHDFLWTVKFFQPLGLICRWNWGISLIFLLMRSNNMTFAKRHWYCPSFERISIVAAKKQKTQRHQLHFHNHKFIVFIGAHSGPLPRDWGGGQHYLVAWLRSFH